MEKGVPESSIREGELREHHIKVDLEELYSDGCVSRLYDLELLILLDNLSLEFFQFFILAQINKLFIFSFKCFSDLIE